MIYLTSRYWLTIGVVAAVVVCAGERPARADIFKWEYINPANPIEGTRQSTTLAPDGAGYTVTPGVSLAGLNLTKAYLVGADLGPIYVDGGDVGQSFVIPANLSGTNLSQSDLTNANLIAATLSNANLSQANLAGATLTSATLVGADLSGATIGRSDFTGSAISVAQIYATASYQNRLMAGVALGGNSLTGADFSHQNLTNASFAGAELSAADFSQAVLTNVAFHQATLDGADLTRADLTGAQFSEAVLTGANLTLADVRGASFSNSHLTASQLSTTTSYQARDLAGIGLSGNDLSGGDFTMQNLVGAGFVGSTLINADFTQANLTNAGFHQARLTGANFTGAIVGGADFTDYGAGGISQAQLYATASYHARDLAGIVLNGNDLPGADFAGQNLTGADFQVVRMPNADFRSANLVGADFYGSYVANANLSQANLMNASLDYAWLTGADFTGAIIRGADFTRQADPLGDYGSGLSVAQLQSTSSYQAGDLRAVNLAGSNLAGANLVGQDLTDANFGRGLGADAADLTSANLAQANLTNAQLQYVNLANTNLSEADLSHANLRQANLSGAVLSGTNISGVDFSHNHNSEALTLAQLYSTVTYQNGDLSGIKLGGFDLSGAVFSGKNLSHATFADPALGSSNLAGANFSRANLAQVVFANANLANADLSHANLEGAQLGFRDFFYGGANLTGADLSHTNLSNAHLAGLLVFDEFGEAFVYPGADLTGANLSGADTRGADFQLATLTGAITTHLIQTNGHVAGLDLTAGQLLVVRDYDGRPAENPPVGPLPVVIDERLSMDASGMLRLVFEADPWDSLISFDAGVPVQRGGTLELTFTSDVDLATQVGRTLHIFDWTGVSPTGQFQVDSPYVWDVSKLYTTGEVTFTAVPEPNTLLLGLLCLGLWMRLDLRVTSRARRQSSHELRRRHQSFSKPQGMQPIMTRGAVVVVTALALASAIPQANAGSPAMKVRAVALSGQTAPGTSGGALFRDFNAGYFSLNDSGQVAFLGYLTGDNVGGFNAGIWSEGSGDLALVARRGDVAPGTDSNLRYDEVFSPVLNNSGRTLFSASLTNFSITGSGAWSDRSGSLELVVQNGTLAPGTSGDVSFVGIGGALLNDVGQTAFRGAITGTGVDPISSEGIWSEGSGSLSLVARSGSHAAGMPDGINFDVLTLPVLNDSGTIAFSGYVVASDLQSGFGQGVWTNRSSNLAPVAVSDTQAPGAPSGANFAGFAEPSINNAGQTAFWAYLDSSNPNAGEPHHDGVWMERTDMLELVALRGSPAPGMPAGVHFGNEQFITFDRPVLNNAGQTAFRAYVDGMNIDQTNNEGIWMGADRLSLVARAGDQAPGASDGVTFGTFFPWHGGLELNDAGQVAFTAFLADDTDPFSDGIGIWATDLGGALHLIARTGDLMEVAPDDVRTISALNFVYDGTGNSDGRPSGLNSRGQIAFWARFNDGTQGIFVSDRVAVPEPSTLGLIVVGIASLLVRRLF